MEREIANRIWQKKLNSLFKEANLPKSYYQAQELVERIDDIKTWNALDAIRNDIVQRVDDGLILTIISANVGNGKTSWAIRLLQRYLAETAINGKIEKKGYFINYASLVTKLSSFEEHKTDSYKEMMNYLKNSHLLVIDELGSAKLNSVSYPLLYDIINYRNEQNLSTIYTTNYTLDVLELELQERLFSRIIDCCELAEFFSSNVRGYSIDEIKELEGLE